MEKFLQNSLELTRLTGRVTEVNGDSLRQFFGLYNDLPLSGGVPGVAGSDESQLRVANLLFLVLVRFPAPAALLRPHRGSKSEKYLKC